MKTLYNGLCNNHEIQSVIVQEEGKKVEDKLNFLANPLLFCTLVCFPNEVNPITGTSYKTFVNNSKQDKPIPLHVRDIAAIYKNLLEAKLPISCQQHLFKIRLT